MNATVKEWVAKAEGDYRAAERELHPTGTPNLDAVCFHAEQCAEKLMKALLIHLGVTPRRGRTRQEIKKNRSDTTQRRRPDLAAIIDLAPTRASVISNPIPDEESRRSANTAHLLATCFGDALPSAHARLERRRRSRAMSGKRRGCARFHLQPAMKPMETKGSLNHEAVHMRQIIAFSDYPMYTAGRLRSSK